MSDAELGATGQTVPHVLDQVLVHLRASVRAIHSWQIDMHELNRSLDNFIDPLYDIIFNLHLNLESFKIDLWLEAHHALIQVINYICHKHKHAIFVILKT